MCVSGPRTWTCTCGLKCIVLNLKASLPQHAVLGDKLCEACYTFMFLKPEPTVCSPAHRLAGLMVGWPPRSTQLLRRSFRLLPWTAKGWGGSPHQA